MEDLIINFQENRNSFEDIADVETLCLFGNPNNVPNAQVTICIPTYKRTSLLKRAIDSALSQKTNIPFLVFVVDNEDDFSETDTFRLIQSCNDDRLVYYKNKKNLGMGGNWNRCGEIVRTEYFALLHDDDILLPTYLNDISNYLTRKKYDFIFVGYNQENSPFCSNEHYVIKKKIIVKKILKKYLKRKQSKICMSDNLFFDNIFGAPTCGVIIKKDTFCKSGGFNMQYYPALDWYYFIYALNNYKCIKFNKVEGIYFWGKNESLKESVLQRFKEQREQVIRSLSNTNLNCRIYYFLLKKEFIKKMNSRIETPFKSTSFFYNLIFRIKLLKYIRLQNNE